MSNVDKIAKDLAGIIKSSDSKATAPYDTKAIVKKVENGIAWVQIPGGVDETPVDLTIDAKAGDTVLLPKYGGTEVKLGEKKLQLVREEDLLGVVEK